MAGLFDRVGVHVDPVDDPAGVVFEPGAGDDDGVEGIAVYDGGRVGDGRRGWGSGRRRRRT